MGESQKWENDCEENVEKGYKSGKEEKIADDDVEVSTESKEKAGTSSEISSEVEDTSTTDMENLEDVNGSEEDTDGEDFSDNDVNASETMSHEDGREDVTESADSKQDNSCSLYSTDVIQIADEIRKADSDSNDSIQKTKYELLVLYLINLSLYKKIVKSPEEHPAHEILLRISEMLNQTIKLEKELDNDKAQETREIRNLTTNMKKNRGEDLLYVKSGKTPREKHKRKARELENKKQAKASGSIEMMVTKSSKFK
ncbi:hypothetical protein SLOPH_1723 [Spraguea lophii 42_110]|uniref:Uncharacterized protein n=1 Tax=Spraguea lophii (strain 42_110) TaxID=1358809 RepID=S7W7B1_SPRLO|nr:hypothetical protein SLOPH_1723 [Spraguea lophii 42_110]